ncbi:MAG TPA: BTAD domain-containing putative transcriptional regulator [Pseudonocardiaceae bacterium]|nr:BTAD domain-containing putative transcriptional regulator [Pseudonocardiaceae bacterium]
MRVALLGPLRLATENGEEVPLGGVRLRMLLARLALEPGRFVPASALVDGLWGDQPPADAANALQSLVSRLRRTIRDATGVADVVLSGPAGYQLAVAATDVDVTRFDRLAGEGRAHLRADRPGPAEAACTEALRLWHGPALADGAEAPFAAPVAARLTEARLAVAEDRCEAVLAQGRPADALAELDHLVADHPLRERLVALRLRALAGVGRPADALADYDRIRRELAAELGVDPSAELRAAHLAVLRGDAAQSAPPPTRTRADLPAPLTSFVGRDAELAEASALLNQGRLVSLVGAGGAGKTRLAVELAGRVGTPGRVWFVELAPVREDAGLTELAPAVLSALELRDVRIMDGAASRDAVDRLVEQFAGRPGLLVLDNCEHLVAGAAELADVLLRRCAALTVLATTREPLAVTGEVGYRVGPLDLPAEQASLAEARESPAVRLFVDRAAAARPGFTLTEANLNPVIEICRRLDGMPLALELAAARLRAMTPRQVADLLDDRFRLLTVGSRASLPRHRTLRAVVEWSWDLLTKPERVLARRCALLPAGADEDAVVGVCVDDDLPADDIPYLLASLVEKSLLTVVIGQDDRPRYRMLETVRAYGLAELAESGEADRIGAAFVDHFVTVVERTEPLLRTRDQLHALALLAAEHDNVMAALDRAVAMSEADLAARMVAGMAWYWTMAGNGNEAANWAKVIIALPPGQDTPATVAVRLALLAGDNTEADVAAVDLDDLWARGERVGMMDRYPMLGLIEAITRIRTGDTDGAAATAARLTAGADPWTAAAGRLITCFVAAHGADTASAETELLTALEGFRELGERWGSAFTLGLLGQYRMMRGDRAGAVAAHEEAVRIASEVVVRNNLPPMQLMQLGAARGMSGDLDGAERDVRTALATVDSEDRGLRLMGLCVLIHIAVLRADLPAARQLAADADHVAGPDVQIADWAAALGMAKAMIALAADELDEVGRHLDGALSAVAPVGDMSSLASVGERIAVLVGRRGDDRAAAELLGAAAGIRGLLDQGEPHVRTLVAGLTERLGDDGYRTAFRRGFDLDRATAVEVLRNAVRQRTG